MRERLRKITHHPPRRDIVFLGEQAHITAKGQQALEQFARFSASAEQDKVVGIPKAAGEERTFSTAT
jgi:hypothetical protein